MYDHMDAVNGSSTCGLFTGEDRDAFNRFLVMVLSMIYIINNGYSIYSLANLCAILMPYLSLNGPLVV